jgi:manganese transport protein
VDAGSEATAQQLLQSRGRLRGGLALLGPAFVAAVAYIDPGNFATNISAGAHFGYTLAWVIVVANVIAILVQYLSAKAGVATGMDLSELCREHLPVSVSRGLWVQAELIAMATDLAEFVGAAVALNLLFGIPLFASGLITAVVAFGILELQQRGHRRFEVAVTALLGLVLLGFAYDLLRVRASGSGVAHGLVPHLPGGDGRCSRLGSSAPPSCRTWCTCTPR